MAGQSTGLGATVCAGSLLALHTPILSLPTSLDAQPEGPLNMGTKKSVVSPENLTTDWPITTCKTPRTPPAHGGCILKLPRSQ